MSFDYIKTAEEFASVLGKHGGLVVVDFTASWCGPCKMIAPKIEALAKVETTVGFYRVDVDELEEVAAAQKVSAMPTFKFFKGGKQVAEIVGANYPKIEATVKEFK